MMIDKRLIRTVRAVSYTHLDVYKRQLCILLTVPCADRKTGSSTGSYQQCRKIEDSIKYLYLTLY